MHYVVLHDQNGQVVHVHKHISFNGQLPAPAELEHNARRLLERARPNSSAALMVLHAEAVPPVAPGHKLAADIAAGKLVVVPRPPAAAIHNNAVPAEEEKKQNPQPRS